MQYRTYTMGLILLFGSAIISGCSGSGNSASIPSATANSSSLSADAAGIVRAPQSIAKSGTTTLSSSSLPTGWSPYTSGPLTQPVPSNPAFTSNSAAVINAMWSANPNDAGVFTADANDTPPTYKDFSMPTYFGQATDPVYTITCVMYGGKCGASGAHVHIPNGAWPAGGSDHHIAVRDTTNGTDYEIWEWTNPNAPNPTPGQASECPACNAPVPITGGGVVKVAWAGSIPSSSNGLNVVGGTASGLSGLWAVRATDLENNTINHAIPLAINGESPDGYVYPAVGWDNRFFHADPWVEMGAHLWLDVAPPYAPGCPQYAVSILTALNKYGAYFAAYGGTTHAIAYLVDSDNSYTFNGGASVWGPFMQGIGQPLQGLGTANVANCGINMQAHMHVLTPPNPS